MEVMALIPARSGSKGILHKNISLFCGKPLLSYSIIQAKNAETVTRVVVSTDSELYAEIAREYGADTPFLRPYDISGDLTKDLEVFEHALNWLYEHENYRPDICVHLRPTYPTRKVSDIDKAVELLKSDLTFDSVRSVVKIQETPFKMWFMSSEGELSPVILSNLHEPYNNPRQSLPPTYQQNANIDVVWTKVILEQHSMTGKHIRGLLLEDYNDIDNPYQFEAAKFSLTESLQNKRFVIDIDGIIATITAVNNYILAKPITENINLVNVLYEAGNTIILYTARGSMTGVDWSQLTIDQLKSWNVKYHEIRFDKPYADYYIDDRFVSINQLRSWLSNINKGSNNDI